MWSHIAGGSSKWCSGLLIRGKTHTLSLGSGAGKTQVQQPLLGAGLEHLCSWGCVSPPAGCWSFSISSGFSLLLGELRGKGEPGSPQESNRNLRHPKLHASLGQELEPFSYLQPQIFIFMFTFCTAGFAVCACARLLISCFICRVNLAQKSPIVSHCYVTITLLFPLCLACLIKFRFPNLVIFKN